MSRTRASISSSRGEVVPDAVVETPSRDRGRDQARGHSRGVAPVRGDFVKNYRCARELLSRWCNRYATGFLDKGRGADPNLHCALVIHDQLGPPPVILAPVVGVQIAPEVILMTAEQ
ncbi:hypothetical protein KY290_036737 [Solanum tuberosum]|uniref:Integrase core domain containing protein n=1 Tax=Solanum tuberosum TaxID=4113 RepID=A0ABQ7TV77_SOLTU|nr:hypothetical protein KY285_036053 [Solanum tuberosum]KAH0738032.1 hypothetical protein KY290_036737 [Solanum tuberosum]